MKILLTGANGYLGSNLLKILSDKQVYIVAIARDLSKVCKSLKKIKNVEWIECDLISIGELIINDIDLIVHLAAQTKSPGISLQQYIMDNVIATQKLIDFSRNNQVRSIVYSSTVSVYGDVLVDEIDENSDIVNPDNYGRTKFLAENLFKEEQDINTLVVRLPGIVGGGPSNAWLSRVIKMLKYDEEVNIFNPYSGFNNIVYVNDFAELVYGVLTQNKIKSFDTLIMSCSGCKTIFSTVEYARILLSSRSKVSINNHYRHSFIISNKKLVEKYKFIPTDIDNIIEGLCCE